MADLNDLLEALIARVADEVTSRVVQAVGKQPSPPPERDDQEWLTTSEAAKYLKYSRDRLEKLRSLKEGPIHTGEGRRVRYKRADLDAWLALRTQTREAKRKGKT